LCPFSLDHNSQWGRGSRRRAPAAGRPPNAVCALWRASASDADGVESVSATGGRSGGGGWARHRRLAGLPPLPDALTSGMLGAQPADSPETPATDQEGPVALVSGEPSCPSAIPGAEARSETPRAWSVRRESGPLPLGGSGAPLCGKGVVVLVESTQQSERAELGEIPVAPADVGSAHPHDRPQHLRGRPGQHRAAPEACRDAGSRRTGGVHCTRPGLWGGRVGKHRLSPEADAQ
jgi:hypothetical protein